MGCLGNVGDKCLSYSEIIPVYMLNNIQRCDYCYPLVLVY